jgi:hypothetical protein
MAMFIPASLALLMSCSGSCDENWYCAQLESCHNEEAGLPLNKMETRLGLGRPALVQPPTGADPYYWNVYTTTAFRVHLAASPDVTSFVTNNQAVLLYAYAYVVTSNNPSESLVCHIPASCMTKRLGVEPHTDRICHPSQARDETNTYVLYLSRLVLTNKVTIPLLERELKLPKALETQGSSLSFPQWSVVYYKDSTLICLGANLIAERALGDDSTSNFVFSGYWYVTPNFTLP